MGWSDNFPKQKLNLVVDSTNAACLLKHVTQNPGNWAVS